MVSRVRKVYCHGDPEPIAGLGLPPLPLVVWGSLLMSFIKRGQCFGLQQDRGETGHWARKQGEEEDKSSPIGNAHTSKLEGGMKSKSRGPER